MARLTVIGAGLAGCEAAYQAARQGIEVTLIEMRPGTMTPAHRTGALAELVCSNSLRSNETTTAAGLLKEELRCLGSLLICLADRARVAAGSALAVDREQFSALVAQELALLPAITVERREVSDFDWEQPHIVAAGPLVGDALASHLAARLGRECCHFYDAISPVVEAESIAQPPVFRASRYGKGGAAGDYLNLPLTEETYLELREGLLAAARVTPHPFEDEKYFEACLPVEELARRGVDTMRFGPLKPVGLTDPATGSVPYAVIQLRQDDRNARFYNLVGFQTRLRFGDQEKILQRLPGLRRVRIARHGAMHRNTYFDVSHELQPTLALRSWPLVYLAGQLAGSEGYTEAIALGWLAGMNAGRALRAAAPVVLPGTMALGGLARYLTTPAATTLVPMHATFGLLDPAGVRGGRRRRREYQAARALAAANQVARELQAA